MPHVERLQNLHRVVSNVDPESLDLTRWHGAERVCLFGHACRDPWHNAEGLSIKTIENWPWLKEQSRAPDRTFRYTTPVYEDAFALQAASRFYGIAIPQAEFLFLPASYSGNASAILAEALHRITGIIGDEP